MTRFIFLVVIFIIAGCGEKIPLNESKKCLPQNDDAKNFSEALHKKEIPHIFNESEKCIYTANEYQNQLKVIDKAVFGEPPPSGLSISWESKNPELIILLEKNGIAIKKYVFHGFEYIAWSFNDHEKVEELLEFEPWKKEMYRRFREENASQT